MKAREKIKRKTKRCRSLMSCLRCQASFHKAVCLHSPIMVAQEARTVKSKRPVPNNERRHFRGLAQPRSYASAKLSLEGEHPKVPFILLLINLLSCPRGQSIRTVLSSLEIGIAVKNFAKTMEASFLPKETALVLERIPQEWYTASKATT